MAQNVVELTDANWESEVINSSVPVLVDFWAPWCGPCRIIAPVVEKLAGEFAGQIKVGKLNTDDNPGVSMRYGIRAIPTIMMFKNGEVVDTRVGVQPEDSLRKMIKNNL
ncbi:MULTISPECIES: thioredoxin [unclassified Hydrogenobaculum]|jgi:thioredoxin|uniref:thioredoxin n=1 Tax=unclassified Hydrogenobaculum TaxID=2622382 RepID=UPI0001C515EA|nr:MULTISPECIES: thioredoxin [unclassified Hydrogenobaculum]AEF19008.1 thioredoxin [Hydrogenobaculum sp. 3684]AEG46295.1 thioredoxin [Hydrogenobaculum sp. SHO]AGG14940.1 thioredoxin [Hydrogenobaculum sp. HO]AGH93236.1 thioredoxin [Hydrogenobaculum sp. SN]